MGDADETRFRRIESDVREAFDRLRLVDRIDERLGTVGREVGGLREDFRREIRQLNSRLDKQDEERREDVAADKQLSTRERVAWIVTGGAVLAALIGALSQILGQGPL